MPPIDDSIDKIFQNPGIIEGERSVAAKPSCGGLRNDAMGSFRFVLAAAVLALVACAAPSRETGQGCAVPRLAASPAPGILLGDLGMPPGSLRDDEIAAMAHCLGPDLDAAFARVRDKAIDGKNWTTMSTSYRASEHGMFLQVYADAAAAPSYRLYEMGARMPEGATLLKRSFRVGADGKAEAFRIFIMTRERTGYAPDAHDWRFAVFQPDGTLIGETGGRGDANVRFCIECHRAAQAQDYLLFVPPRFRIDAR